MKITKIKIGNFKSILNQTVDGFTNINMIFGHNNSGKSNFLRFINLIFEGKIQNDAGTRVDESRLGSIPQLSSQPNSIFWSGIIKDVPYIFHNNNRSQNIVFEVEFEETIESFQLNKSFPLIQPVFLPPGTPTFTVNIKGEILPRGIYDAEIVLYSALLNGQEIYNKDPAQTYFSSVPAGTNLELTENGYETFQMFMSYFNDSVLFIDNDRYFTTEMEDSKISDISPRTFKNWIHNLSLNPDRFSELVGIIAEIALYRPTGDAVFNETEKSSPFNNDFQFQFSRINEQINLFFSNKHKLRLPIESFGTGIQQVLYLLTKIAEKKPKILLIEELELNLSPKYQMELLQHFLLKYIEVNEKMLKQIFFTTHSPNLCYRADFQIHNVLVNKKGETEISRFGEKKELIKEFYPAELIKILIEQNIPAPK